MVRDRVTRRWGLRTGMVMAFVLLVLGSAAPVLANNDGTTGIAIGVDDATPDDTVGGIVPEPEPTMEETPDDGLEEEEGTESAPPSATPGGDQGGEAVAPGTVTVVLWTSDGGLLPERALVCIGEVCQSASGGRSGIDLWFDRVEKGWQQVVVRVGAPYGDTTMEVDVRPGTNNKVDLTLVATKPDLGDKLDPTPVPKSAEGPLRVAPVVQESTSSPALSVSALPATGASRHDGHSAGVPITLVVTAAFLLAAAAVVRTARRG